jgi:quercetin dioxygenase-like cupin family protein
MTSNAEKDQDRPSTDRIEEQPTIVSRVEWTAARQPLLLPCGQSLHYRGRSSPTWRSAMRLFLLALSFSVSASIAAAQGTRTPGAQHAILVMPDQVSWGPGPAALPPGAKASVLQGDPEKAETFTLRLSLPDGYRVPPHSHPADELVTVIEGTFRIGMGDKFDASALTTLPPGGFVAMQPGTRHFVQTRGETVVQIHGIGPWKINYVNPADDPRRRTP